VIHGPGRHQAPGFQGLDLPPPTDYLGSKRLRWKRTLLGKGSGPASAASRLPRALCSAAGSYVSRIPAEGCLKRPRRALENHDDAVCICQGTQRMALLQMEHPREIIRISRCAGPGSGSLDEDPIQQNGGRFAQWRLLRRQKIPSHGAALFRSTNRCTRRAIASIRSPRRGKRPHAFKLGPIPASRSAAGRLPYLVVIRGSSSAGLRDVWTG